MPVVCNISRIFAQRIRIVLDKERFLKAKAAFLQEKTGNRAELRASQKHFFIKNMKKGQRLIYLVFYTGLERSAKEKRLTYENYKDVNLTEFLISKALRDSLLVLNKYLKLEKTHKNPDGYTLYVFEKL